ncbi:sensor histidine kinase [Evansella cellulosilytica]|uniref:Signal transduction histidine kinase regulating citrate/malate metabolism n=1 Tax=Evansella cellulosilytica (strain ATCC 21833 / DSM 2522 / FERM P-1141 / JCM 9156 / N-4) TaxID=649639 RepID=E6TT70_EVAC2|nr:GHKL domain-containing protein [Evansella cellulosilytica]ADU31978.1 signal transduction histidine kinase regulating citrate/malate metabolism [Evansella cellulosilytica DSM 2522]
MDIRNIFLIILVQIILVFFFITSMALYNERLYIFEIPVHLLFIIVLNVLSLFLLARMYRHTVKKKLTLTESTHEQEFHSLVASVRSDRHDLNNHLTVILGLMKIGNYSKAHEYLNQMVGDIHINNKALSIKNPILASILFSKMELYHQNQIEFSVHVESEEITHILSSTDLIRLIGNLLDNAFDATMELTEEKRNINFQIYEKDKEVEIIVENSTVQESFNRDFFKMGQSSKGKTGKRGYGLSIISEIIKKYDGNFDVQSENNIVIFQITFPQEQAV